MTHSIRPETLAKWRIHLGQIGGVGFILLAQPRLRWVFLIGFLLALLGEAVRIWAAGTIKKNKELASEGPYALVRHPLYLGSFLITLGLAVSSLNPYNPGRTLLVWLLAVGGFALVYRRKMIDEEDKIAGLFGEAHARYRQSVPMFLPDFRQTAAMRRGAFDLAQALHHKEHHTVAGVLGGSAVLWMKLIYQL